MANRRTNRPNDTRVRFTMHMRTRKLALGVLVAVLPTSYAFGRAPISRFRSDPAFDLLGRPIGGARPASATAAYLTGSRIMAAGDGALVIDADSGALVKTDKDGRNVGQVSIARDAGLMTFDPSADIAYVADRKNDRIAVVKTSTMTITSHITTPAEPFGVALSPDRKLLLVSTIADRTLVAYDTASGTERWRAPLGSEPRGLAVSPDGSRALVAYLNTGTVDQIELAGARRTEHIALSTTGSQRTCRRCGNDGDSFARGAFAVTFLGEHQAVVPFQREVPVQATERGERTGSYGGGTESPLRHELAFLGFGDGRVDQTTAGIAQHQPRALAWDSSHDALYVAGMGNDTILQIKNASQASIGLGSVTSVSASAERCGPDGLAVTATGDVLVWCAFTRSVQRVEFHAAPEPTPEQLTQAEAIRAQLVAQQPSGSARKQAVDQALLAGLISPSSAPGGAHPSGWGTDSATVTQGAPVIASAMTPKQHEGLVLFHAADERVSERGSLACASCHPDNRADGLSWKIEKRALQTPLLSGRLVGTHPFKWDGTDPTLRDSLRSTMKRLGGTGLSRHETDALAAYLEALPAPRTPTREATQVARGKQLFETEGCRSCHDGPAYTDRERHKFPGTLPKSDTPSLVGVAASAPYFHDGSAATLEALLRDRGAVHGMADTARLTDQQVRDLTAFLETL